MSRFQFTQCANPHCDETAAEKVTLPDGSVKYYCKRCANNP